MSINATRLFVASADAGRVVDEIRRYAARHGGAAVWSLDSDEVCPLTTRRDRRTFTVSVPRHGYVVVWEDGRWADRLLARHLSGRLDTEVIFFTMSETAGSWGYLRYEHGEEAEKVVDEESDPYPAAVRFITEHRLPFPLVAFEDPTVADVRLAPEAEAEVARIMAMSDEELDALWEAEAEEIEDEGEDEELDDDEPGPVEVAADDQRLAYLQDEQDNLDLLEAQFVRLEIAV